MNFPTVIRLDLPSVWQRVVPTCFVPFTSRSNLQANLVRLLCNPWTLLICKLTIGMVSAYDIYLTVKYFESLPMMELNPIGRWLMSLENGPECSLNQIAAFMASKFAGNFIALAVIALVAHWRYAAATAVALTVAVFQLGLLCFLLIY